MSTDPQQISAEVDALLAGLPNLESGGVDPHGVDINAIGHQLEEAHQVLVRALESVEKG